MASVYILYSKKLNRFYIGSCKDVDFRVEQHVNKFFKGSFTTQAEDWEMFLRKDDLGYTQARRIEKHIKTMKSKIYLQNLKKHPEIFQKLTAQYC